MMEDWSLSQSTQRRNFTSLIASRLERKRKIPSQSELQKASINLINRNQNISALLQETSAGAASRTHTCDPRSALTDASETRGGEIRAGVLECELRRQAEELCVPVSVLSVRMVIDRITALQENVECAMIGSAHRAELILLLHATRELLNVGVFSPKLFWQEYWKCQPVLEVVYRLHTEELLPLQYTLTSESGVSVWLVSQLQSLCACQVTEDEADLRHHILFTVVCVLVRVGFEEVQDSSVSHACCSVLDTMLTWLLDAIESTDPSHTTDPSHITDPSQCVPAGAEWLRVFETSAFAGSVSEDAVRRFFTHTLTHTLTHRPRLKVSDAIAMQSQWSFAKTSGSMTSLFCKVCVIFGMEEVCSHLQQVLETLEVNWQHVLSCISTLLVYHTHTQACLKELLSKLLSSAFHSYDVEKMITAFLLARQGALEGPAIFSSYSDWFKISFGGSNSYHGNSKKSLVFLLKFLSDLVPFDPPQYLKVHIMHPPYVPGKHRSLLQEFISLSRTRLSDLKVSVEQMGMYEVVSGAATEAQPECVAQQDVEKAVALFQSTKRISATVMEASIFRRPYFLSRFLPALLTPRVLPETPDNLMVFIEALKKAEKIPAALYSSYTESCMSLQQGAGASESEDHDPQVGVHTKLMQLKSLLSTGSTEGEIRAQISVLSRALSGVCDQLEKQSECEIRTLNLDPHTPLHTPQVVNVMLQGFCECVLAACRFAPPNRQCQWVKVFVKMLIGHTQLYTHFLHRVLQLLYLQGSTLSPAHVLSLAVLVVELHVCRDQIPPVDLSHSTGLTHSIRLPPSEALSDVLPSSTASAMDFSLRLCVLAVCYALCKSSSHTEELAHFVPSRLYKRLLFLGPRLIPELRSGLLAAVSPDDKGADEEECEGAWVSVTDCRRSMRSSVKAVWGHTAIRDLQKHPEHQLSFSEWLAFELRVQRSQDALSDTERSVCQRWACQQWFFSLCESAGGCEGNTATACTHIINTVLDAGVSPVPYSSVVPHTDSCCVDILARLQELLWELQFTRRRRVREESFFLWNLIAQKCSLTIDPQNIGSELDLQRTLHTCNSVILAVPSPLLVCVCVTGGRSMLECTGLIDHINNYQRRVCSPPGVLSCSLTTHFLSAVLSASVNCESPVEAINATLSKLSVRCPLLLLSAVRWWECLYPVLCSLWGRVNGGQQPEMLQLLTDCTQWASRWVSGVPDHVPSAPALVLAVCLHRAVELQGGDSERVKALIHQHREVLVFLLFFYITDLLSEQLTSQGDQSVSHTKNLTVHLITLLADSPDWLSLFNQSGCGTDRGSEEFGVYTSFVSMVTTDLCVRLMPFALFSVLVDVDVSVLSRVMVTSGFLLHAVMSYTALMKLFLLGHSADVKTGALHKVLSGAQHIVLKSISLTRPGSITYKQLKQMEAECTELDPEVAAALSALMKPDDPQRLV